MGLQIRYTFGVYFDDEEKGVKKWVLENADIRRP
jgi:hypothetical protein